MKWISDWSEIESEASYFVCPINKTEDRYWLGQPERLVGWQVKRRRKGLYAALLMPECDVNALVDAAKGGTP